MSKTKTPEEIIERELKSIVVHAPSRMDDIRLNSDLGKHLIKNVAQFILQQEHDSQKEQLEKAFNAGSDYNHDVDRFIKEGHSPCFIEWYKQQQ